jgi:hypothetical protein
MLELEKIGDTWPWVALIIGLHPQYRLRRVFLNGLTDFSRANARGSRGIYKIFELEDGLYEIFEPRGWSRRNRYFAHVKGGDLTRISAAKALELAYEMEATHV